MSNPNPSGCQDPLDDDPTEALARLHRMREADYELVKQYDVYGSGGDLSGCLREMLRIIESDHPHHFRLLEGQLTEARASARDVPVPMLLWCPGCGGRHIDAGEFATKPHHTHACQECGLVWRPALLPTVGVQFLPGFQNKLMGPA